MVEITKSATQFLSEPNLATVATIRKDGTPHLTYVWFLQDGNDILMTTTRDRVKAKNLLRDNRASIAVPDPKNPQRFFIAEGRIEITDDRDASFYGRIGTKYVGADRAKANAEAAHQRGERRIILRLKLQRLFNRGL